MLVAFGISGICASEEKPKTNLRFEIHGRDVYDTTTNLTWQRCSVGQRWIETTGCVGAVAEFTFDEAQAQGSSNWFVPTSDELKTLVDEARVQGKQIPTINAAVFPSMDRTKLVYWTRTQTSLKLAWVVYFDGIGAECCLIRGEAGALRLVRGGR